MALVSFNLWLPMRSFEVATPLCWYIWGSLCQCQCLWIIYLLSVPSNMPKLYCFPRNPEFFFNITPLHHCLLSFYFLFLCSVILTRIFEGDTIQLTTSILCVFKWNWIIFWQYLLLASRTFFPSCKLVCSSWIFRFCWSGNVFNSFYLWKMISRVSLLNSVTHFSEAVVFFFFFFPFISPLLFRLKDHYWLSLHSLILSSNDSNNKFSFLLMCSSVLSFL